MKNKSKYIRFRCSKDMYDFIENLQEVGNKKGGNTTKSDVVRNIINIFRVSAMFDELKLNQMMHQLKNKLKEERIKDSDLPLDIGQDTEDQ